MHWSYIFLALTHRNNVSCIQCVCVCVCVHALFEMKMLLLLPWCYVLVFTECLTAAVTGTEVNGLFFDLVKFLLMAIFNLQAEEEEEEMEFHQEHLTAKGNRHADHISMG